MSDNERKTPLLPGREGLTGYLEFAAEYCLEHLDVMDFNQLVDLLIVAGSANECLRNEQSDGDSSLTFEDIEQLLLEESRSMHDVNYHSIMDKLRTFRGERSLVAKKKPSSKKKE
jgi:hypothetical protein